jgi:hypothetical protein
MAIVARFQSGSFLFKQGKNRYSQTPSVLTQEAIMANAEINNNAVVTIPNKILRPQTANS